MALSPLELRGVLPSTETRKRGGSSGLKSVLLVDPAAGWGATDPSRAGEVRSFLRRRAFCLGRLATTSYTVGPGQQWTRRGIGQLQRRRILASGRNHDEPDRYPGTRGCRGWTALRRLRAIGTQSLLEWVRVRRERPPDRSRRQGPFSDAGPIRVAFSGPCSRGCAGGRLESRYGGKRKMGEGLRRQKAGWR